MFDLMKRKAPTPGAGSPEFNQSIKYQLHAMGDDGTSARHVLHYAYPEDTSASVKADIIEDLSQKHGLEMREAVGEGGYVFEHKREVASSLFDQFTTQLADDLRKLGYDYDGWECAVAQG